jgi:hypothetical protein
MPILRVNDDPFAGIDDDRGIHEGMDAYEGVGDLFNVNADGVY